MRHLLSAVTALMAAIMLALPGMQVAQAEVSKETLKSISIPDKVRTSIGTLEFFDGVPTGDTVQTVYDNLDRMRGVDVYLDRGTVRLDTGRAAACDGPGHVLVRYRGFALGLADLRDDGGTWIVDSLFPRQRG